MFVLRGPQLTAKHEAKPVAAFVTFEKEEGVARALRVSGRERQDDADIPSKWSALPGTLTNLHVGTRCRCIQTSAWCGRY